MKTKNFLMLLAAVLLSCASAFAQSGNNESLKGDVNGDGTVDVADLTAIIKIMKEAGGAVGEKMYYWYAGTKQVEESNFTDIANRIPESEIPETGSVSAIGQYVYFVMPETKRLASLVGSNGSPIKYDCTEAFGYHIYKTSSTINETVYYAVEQITYYWYAGQTDPSTMTEISPMGEWGVHTNGIECGVNGGGWYELGTTIPETITQLVKGGDPSKYWYVAVPITSGTTLKPVASDMMTLDTSVSTQGTKSFNGISYQIYWYGGATAARNTFRFAKK